MKYGYTKGCMPDKTQAKTIAPCQEWFKLIMLFIGGNLKNASLLA
jgi:hypothetical protein